MAKDNNPSRSSQEKVTLRPTTVGALVIRRLGRPHIDKSAELRRLIELGFAAEQAGFILDGTLLRQGGREWDIQPNLSRDGLTGVPVTPLPKAEPSIESQAELSGISADGARSDDVGDGQAGAPASESSLIAGLRGLSATTSS